MDLLYLLFLPFHILLIFIGFTFTDAADFGPIATLLIGVLGALLIRRSPQRAASRPLHLLMILLSSWPILLLIGLFFLAREFQSVTGAWPQVMANDPKLLVGNISPLFDALYDMVEYLEALSGAWMIVFSTLFLCLHSRFSKAQQYLYISLVAGSVLAACFGFGDLYAWWLD